MKDNNQCGHGPQDSFEDFISRQLRGAHVYLEDEGFTAKVMANLPVSQVLDKRVERLIIGIPVLLISVWVFSRLPWQKAASSIWYISVGADPVIMIKAGIFASAIILLTCLAWFARQLRLM